MTLKSMTGFSRSDGGDGTVNWHWEMRTVNARGLDIRLRLPPGYEALEQKAREACKKYLTRGNVAVSLTVQQEAGTTGIQLNEVLFRGVVEAATRAQKIANMQAPSLDGLLAIRGVLEPHDPASDEAEEARRADLMLQDLNTALTGVVEARGIEGEKLQKAIAAQIDEIETLTEQIEKSPARSPEAIGQRLNEQVGRLLQDGSPLDEQRLHQEAAILAAKADIAEELERLGAHISAARALVESSQPVGRKLDFLTQEFNREANTICSKSNDAEVSKAGLALKAVIDQMREQVQNIE